MSDSEPKKEKKPRTIVDSDDSDDSDDSTYTKSYTYKRKLIKINRKLQKLQEQNKKALEQYRGEYGPTEKANAVEKNSQYAEKRSAAKSRASTVSMRRRGHSRYTDERGNTFRITYIM